ncbi:MAG: hypothetical protein ACI4OS_00920 [Akkermansia sp.]
MKVLFKRLCGRRYYRLWAVAGLLTALGALWQLAQTVLFVHGAQRVPAVVVDVRQQPFESTLGALLGGNAATEGDVSYRPIVRFALPGNDAEITRLMPDADAEDYALDAPLEVLTMPLDPSSARVYKLRLLWAAPTVQLGLGLLLLLMARLLRGARRPAAKAAPTAPAKADRKPAPKADRKASASPAAAESPRKTRTRRKRSGGVKRKTGRKEA